MLLSVKLIWEISVYLLEKLKEHLDSIAIIVIFSLMGMGIYALSSKEPPGLMAKNTFLGGLIAGALSYPTWIYFGYGHMWALILITIGYTITGQFIPEFLQSVVPKAVKKISNIIFKTRFGEDLDDDHKN